MKIKKEAIAKLARHALPARLGLDRPLRIASASAVLILASGSVLACGSGSHESPAEFVEITLKNSLAESTSYEVAKNGNQVSSGSIAPGKSVTWSDSVPSDVSEYFATTMSGKPVEFKVTNSTSAKNGTKYETIRENESISCSKEWGKTAKIWKVTYKLQ